MVNTERAMLKSATDVNTFWAVNLFPLSTYVINVMRLTNAPALKKKDMMVARA